MEYQELLSKVKSGQIAELPKLYSGRVFQIRWHNRRLETLAPGSTEWRFCSKEVLMSDYGIGREVPVITGNILDYLSLGG